MKIMKRLGLTISFLALLAPVKGEYKWKWIKSFSSIGEYHDVAKKITIDKWGNAIVVGRILCNGERH